MQGAVLKSVLRRSALSGPAIQNEERCHTQNSGRQRPLLRWSSDPAAFPDARLIGRSDSRLVRRPEVPLSGRPDGWWVGRRARGRPHNQVISLLARPGRRPARLVAPRAHLEGCNLLDNGEKNYPYHHAQQRIENEILQCISLAHWHSVLGSSAIDISPSLNDTFIKGNRF